MLKSLGYIMIYIAIAFFQIPQLTKDKLEKEIWCFSILMVLVSGITIAKNVGISIPNPLELISFVLDPLLRIFPFLN